MIFTIYTLYTDSIVAFGMKDMTEMWYFMVCFCKVQLLHEWQVWWAFCIIPRCKFNRLYLYQILSRLAKICEVIAKTKQYSFYWDTVYMQCNMSVFCVSVQVLIICKYCVHYTHAECITGTVHVVVCSVCRHIVGDFYLLKNEA